MDGAVARQAGTTDLGGYMDIVFDFLFYSFYSARALLSRSGAWPDSGVFDFLFRWNRIIFLTFAIIAAKHDIDIYPHSHKSFYYLGGLTEGQKPLGSSY